MGGRADEILGRDAPSWPARERAWGDHVADEDRAEALEACRRAIAGHHDATVEYRVPRPGADAAWVRDLIHVVEGSRGPTQLRGLMVDVTDRKLAEQALRASQSSRYKERPEIRFMPASFPLPPILEKILTVLPPRTEGYLVGGAVRDLLTLRLSPDLDFALPSSGISLARSVANSLKVDFMILDDERDTGRVVITNEDGSFTYSTSQLSGDPRSRTIYATSCRAS